MGDSRRCSSGHAQRAPHHQDTTPSPAPAGQPTDDTASRSADRSDRRHQSRKGTGRSQALFQQWQEATRAVCAHAFAPFRQGTINPQFVVRCDDHLNHALLLSRHKVLPPLRTPPLMPEGGTRRRRHLPHPLRESQFRKTLERIREKQARPTAALQNFIR